MLSFFEKSNFKTEQIIFGLKYRKPFIDGLSVYTAHVKYYIKYLDRLPEILNKSTYFGIDSCDLHHLPNNIDNPNLHLRIWVYNGEKLPENWNIDMLFISFSGNYNKKTFFPESFKVRKIFID